MSTLKVMGALAQAGADPGLRERRDAFVRACCLARGWDAENLSTERVLEIRNLREWQILPVMGPRTLQAYRAYTEWTRLLFSLSANSPELSRVARRAILYQRAWHSMWQQYPQP